MVGKATVITHGSNAVHYLVDKEKAKIVKAAIYEARNVSIMVVVSDKSVATIKKLHEQLIEEEKTVISKMEICRKL